MPTYKIMIEEIFTKVIEVEADNYVDAQFKVEADYLRGKPPLDLEDFKEYNFYPVV
jgi:hypothetical protein